MQTIIGLDVGHSAVKASVFSGGKVSHVFIPSVVCPAITITDEVEARRAEKETVAVVPGPSGSFFFGETAIAQGGGIGGLSDNWIATREHQALMMGAIKKIRDEVGFDDAPDLIMGLPARLFYSQKDELERLAHAHIPEVGSIKIISQAAAPLYCIMLDDKGYPTRESSSESWGVVEVGHYTSDFMMTWRGRWAESGSDGCSGVRVAAEHVKRVMAEHRIPVSLAEAEEILQTKQVRMYGQLQDVSELVNEAVNIIVAEVVDTANRLMESRARQLDGVLVAGGGAPLVFDKLKAQWPHAVMVDNHRYAVAEGMRRLGMARALNRQLREAAAA